MMTFLLVLQAIVAAALVAVILMQRSEGGGLGMGGSPTGLMSARGAANFLTRATTILASIFVLLCIGMAVIAAQRGTPATIDTSLRQTAPTTRPQAPAPTPAVPLGGGDPTGVAPAGAPPADGNSVAGPIQPAGNATR